MTPDGPGDSPVAALPPLHVLAGDRQAAAPDFPLLASALLREGGSSLALHLRLRKGPDRRLWELADTLAAEARAGGGWLVVNRRVDVALAVRAQAVQLGRGALPPGVVRGMLPPEVRMGVSVHSAAEAGAAKGDGANHLLAGTIFPTPSHPEGPIAGPELLTRLVGLELPVVAIGGITRERIPAVLAAGAHGVAVVRAVWGEPEPVAAARRLLDALRNTERSP